jgi:flavin reductase (DIM6/NTAB) family NADH-FMN oxidoreductase RutF
VNEIDPIKAMMGALGRVPSGLFVLTAQRAGAETGLLASWVQQCSFQPPQVSIAVRRGRDVLDWLTQGALLTLNVLDEDQTDMISHFGRGFQPGELAFAGLEVSRPGGAPAVLDEALAFLTCRVTARYSAGDHELVIGEVIGGRVLSEGRPMVHVRKTGAHY